MQPWHSSIHCGTWVEKNYIPCIFNSSLNLEAAGQQRASLSRKHAASKLEASITKCASRGCGSGGCPGSPGLCRYFEADSHAGSCCKSNEHFKAEFLPFSSSKI